MSFTNCLPVHSFEGKVGGVSIKWGANGITNLPDNAKALDVDTNGLKAASEHLAFACATRLGKGSIRILYILFRVVLQYSSILTFSKGPLS
jgi:hypothetical protein